MIKDITPTDLALDSNVRKAFEKVKKEMLELRNELRMLKQSYHYHS